MTKLVARLDLDVFLGKTIYCTNCFYTSEVIKEDLNYDAIEYNAGIYIGKPFYSLKIKCAKCEQDHYVCVDALEINTVPLDRNFTFHVQAENIETLVERMNQLNKKDKR